MSYAIEVTRAAQRDLRRLDPQTRDRVLAAIQLLGIEPRPPAAKPLVERPEWRIRIGDYRVLYLILADRLVIQVVRVRHRSHVYDR